MTNFKEISDYDKYLFYEGRHFRSYRLFGAHLDVNEGVQGTRFAVWAPNAEEVSVVGEFNSWRGENHVMRQLQDTGIWQLFLPGVDSGAMYKYKITASDGRRFFKADPYAFWAEVRPGTASKVFGLNGYEWHDGDWPRKESAEPSIAQPMAIYEAHLGSWRRKPDGSFYTYREMAEILIDYVAAMAFTHLELLPLGEHPLDESWGYQTSGYYAPTSRYGNPDDLKYFVDQCHRRGIGVILDWTPGHFCKDEAGLRQFDGQPLYESGNAKQAENQGWGTLNFNFGRPEVLSFLISNAMYWLDVFHFDGLRVDAVANMLYRDYGKKPGEWEANCFGGRENLEAAEFIKKLNEALHDNYPDALIFAEESTTWPLLTKPVYQGGMGFDYKWNMGWMNDTLKYMSLDSISRQGEHHLLTFSLLYAFSEKFLLPLSHDEVVHGKKALLDKMDGDYWQKFANLRAFYGYFMAHPGKKLLFMGGEFGQFSEWNEGRGLDWLLLEYEMHAKLQQYVKDLNNYYRKTAAFWQVDDDWRGFEWIDCHDEARKIISFIRRSRNGEINVVLCNFTATARHEYKVGVPRLGIYRETVNSDLARYGGSNLWNREKAANGEAWQNQPYSITVTLPPLATIYFDYYEKEEVIVNA